MKFKLAVTYGIIIWTVTILLTIILNPLLIDRTTYAEMLSPIIMIIVTGFFGILYIRNFNKNEVIEGILSGIVFIAVDIVLDCIFLILPNHHNIIFQNYELHFLSVIIITLLITTLLGYLAQMSIDLK